MERLINGLNDRDWNWWPLVAWRPEKRELIGPALVLRMTLCFGTVSGALILVVWWRSGGAISVSSVVIALLFGWGLYALLFQSIFAWAWNRRARRLR